MRCLKRRISDAVYRQLVADARAAEETATLDGPGRALRGDSGIPARSTCPRTSTLRISHFPDPRNRHYSYHDDLITPCGLGSQPSAPAC
jgi:hypothetical protein